jgi:hypothetical protein
MKPDKETGRKGDKERGAGLTQALTGFFGLLVSRSPCLLV